MEIGWIQSVQTLGGDVQGGIWLDTNTFGIEKLYTSPRDWDDPILPLPFATNKTKKTWLESWWNLLGVEKHGNWLDVWVKLSWVLRSIGMSLEELDCDQWLIRRNDWIDGAWIGLMIMIFMGWVMDTWNRLYGTRLWWNLELVV
jgi:hypothetical protein